uniref:Uncharacterized protein n=1 Tax=Hemiselmis tepida TaxID=464990 RepID=A0A7S0YG12_9CRYP|mmetsp:Transcript_11259/g.29264  ORF Transcript_11259/g.29264 Transcript_11259/m.29264 type:complete len:252 (+) Transcript_11259:17-772(+)
MAATLPVGELIRMLHDPSPSNRLKALSSASHRPKTPGERGGQALRGALAGCCARDTDPRCRARALSALTSLSCVGDVECVQTALSKLSDALLDMRLAAVDSLSRTARAGDPAVLSAIRARLDEGGQQRNPMAGACRAREANAVRIALVRALGVLLPDSGGAGGGEEARAVACLAEVGGGDWDPEVREAARNVLSSLGRGSLADELRGEEREEWYRDRRIRRNNQLPEACSTMQAALPLCRADRRKAERRGW